MRRNRFPEIAFAGPNAPAGWRGTDARPFLDALNNYSLQDSFQWIEANHSIKAGFQHQRLQDNYRARWDGTLFIANFSNAQTAGFNNGTLQNNTGNSYASYLMGTLSIVDGQRRFGGDVRRPVSATTPGGSATTGRSRAI